MAKVKEKSKTKNKGLKALKIIIGIILAIAVVAVVFIHVTTLPKDINDEKVIYVGGMTTSTEYETQVESAKSLTKNPVMKIMEMIWRFCSYGDAAKHAKQTPPDNVTEVPDIYYMNDKNHYHMLDVFYPSDVKPDGKLPIIIDIHGGGWMYADKDLNDYYCMALASRGYVVYNVSYRLVPDVTVNEQIQDVANALAYIKQHLAEYPGDADNIMLTGDSAGGMLAIYSSIIMQSPELQKTFETVDPNMDLTAVLLTSPVSYMKAGSLSIYTKICWGTDYKTKPTYEYMNLDEIIDYANELPPVYLITSSGDSLANSQTHMAYDLLKEKGFECEMVDYGKEEFDQSLPHVFSVLFPFEDAGKTAIDSALEYYQKAIGQKTATK